MGLCRKVFVGVGGRGSLWFYGRVLVLYTLGEYSGSGKAKGYSCRHNQRPQIGCGVCGGSGGGGGGLCVQSSNTTII